MHRIDWSPIIEFNSVSVKRVQAHKHLGSTLDLKLNFDEHISSILSQVNKLYAVLWKLQTVLSMHSLLTIYKAFIRPHLDYSDAIFDKILDEILIKYESWQKKSLNQLNKMLR